MKNIKILTTTGFVLFSILIIIPLTLNAQPITGTNSLTQGPAPGPARIQGFKLNQNAQKFTSARAATLTYNGPLGGVMLGPETTRANEDYPFAITVTSNITTAVTTVPEGFTAQYSKCINCIDHPAESYVNGNAVELSTQIGGYADLWWKYLPSNFQPNIKKLVEAGLGGYSYGYAPTIVKKDGTYHMFFCSYAGDTSPKSTDAVRYVTSTDGKTWSAASVALLATGYNDQDMNACDPNVVFFKGYYYMYYSDTLIEGGNARTIIQVARSINISGPYLTYTQRETWEKTPLDPKVIIYPLNRATSGYGAGQQQIVVRGDKLYMWYNDDSVVKNGATYMLESNDPLKWTPDASKTLDIPGGAHSPDIKYDNSKGMFVMVRILNAHDRLSSLAYALSTDGLHWTTPVTLISEPDFPNFSNNNGISADETGTLISGQTLVAFAAPYEKNRTTDTWGFWDIYGIFLDLSPILLTPPNTIIIPTPTIPAPVTVPPVTPPAPPSPGQPQSSSNSLSTTSDKFPVTTYSTECPIITKNLSIGSTGTETIALQKYLVNKDLLSSKYVTGYFGQLTQSAVRSYQTTSGIVSYGTPSTTGFGSVGPRTRMSLANCTK